MKSKVIAKKINSEDAVKAPIEKIQEALTESRRVLVASHIDPDGDAVGTQLAMGRYLRDLGKEVHMLIDSQIPEKYKFLPDIDRIVHVARLEGEPLFDTALVLECPTVQRLGTIERFLHDKMTVVHIDHHLDSDPFANINWVDLTASSVGEMAWEYFSKVGYAIKPSVAEQLYTAVLTDTGRFRYNSTTARTMMCAGELIAAGASPQKICDLIYYNIRPEAMKLIGKVLNGIEYHLDGQVCILKLTRQMLAESGGLESDSEGLVDHTLFTRGVRVGALLKEGNGNGTRVSFRSAHDIDVAEIAARFGGGGHFNASGCTLPYDLDEAREKVLALLTEAIHGRS